MGYDRGDSFPFDFLNQMEFHLVQNRMENCHQDHIPFTVKGIEDIVFSVMAIRKTGVSWLLGGQMESPLKPLGSSQHCRMRGLRGSLNWTPFMPRDASVWNSRCKCSHPGTHNYRVRTSNLFSLSRCKGSCTLFPTYKNLPVRVRIRALGQFAVGQFAAGTVRRKK